MSDNEKKNIPGDEETFEDIFSSLREKYNLEPFGGSDEKKEEKKEEEKETFYDPSADSEIDDFFKEAEEGYAALYEEVDAKIEGVDEDALRHEAEVLGVEFGMDENAEEKKEEPQEFEDIYSDSGDEPQEFEDISSDSGNDAEESDTSSETIPAAAAEETRSEEKAEEEFEEEPKKKKGSLFPKKSDPVGEKVRKIVFLISILALIVSAAWLVNDYIIQPYLINRQNAEISELIVDSTDVEPEKIVEKLNNLNEEEKTVTFATLKAQNKDFKAWLAAPGANISLPVVQTTNNDKYLNTGFNGKWLSGGTAFLDSNNKSAFSDMNTVIYGHNMRDGSMFGSIKNYKKLETFKKNPLIYVYTENENYVYKIYSVFLTSAVKSDDNGYVFAYNFINLSSSENFASFMQELKLRSYYDTGVDYQEGDKLLTLSTCDRTVMKNGRLVIVARLVRENEEESVDTAKAVVNSKQKFPAGWYEKKKQSNPYENAVKWIAQ